uniref:Uncharacterized protein n=1 Tax=Melopsittacus undulatus TaxID=13146 RepID=A0A8C6N6Q8_MELUD
MLHTSFSELPRQAAEDMLADTRENMFSSTDLLKSSAERLPGPMFAVPAGRRPSGLAAKRSRKARRVLYPAQVRKYLPREEKDLVKRWLLFFAGIILLQVLSEDPEQEGLAGGKSLKTQPLCAPASQQAAGNSSREDRAVSEAPAIIFSSASGHQPPRQTTADVPQQARRPLHAFCRQCMASFSCAEQ